MSRHRNQIPKGPLRTLRRPLRARSPDGAARATRASVSRSAARSRVSSRAQGSARQLRRPPDAALLRQAAERNLGGAKIYIKREDLLHTGAHKINNCLGQALLARRMGKKRIIAETGAGQHGVATRHGLRALWPGMHRLHGRRGHAPPASQRVPDADAGRQSGGRRDAAAAP